MDNIFTRLKTFGKVKFDEPLSKHTTFKIGGTAKAFVMVETIDQVVALLKFLDSVGEPYMIIGGGSNMLMSDIGYDGVVIHITDKQIDVSGTTLIASAGASTVAVAQASVKAGLAGFEWGVGVPGSIGGAVRGNAGAMGAEMTDNVSVVEVYQDGEIVQYTHDQCQFGYRDSVFKHNFVVILRVHLELQRATTPDGMKKAIEYLQYRNSTQPQGFASTGCIFKNIDLSNAATGQKNKQLLLSSFSETDEKIQTFLKVGKLSAGWLVEQAGLKGEQVGEAQVSSRHGNFIVNLGHASANDVRLLIEKIKQTVYDRFRLELEEEIVMFE